MGSTSVHVPAAVAAQMKSYTHTIFRYKNAQKKCQQLSHISRFCAALPESEYTSRMCSSFSPRKHMVGSVTADRHILRTTASHYGPFPGQAGSKNWKNVVFPVRLKIQMWRRNRPDFLHVILQGGCPSKFHETDLVYHNRPFCPSVLCSLWQSSPKWPMCWVGRYTQLAYFIHSFLPVSKYY